VPKTGGTTIEMLLFNDSNYRRVRAPLSCHRDIGAYGLFYSFYIFTFVRNPYTRLVSIYNYYRHNGNGTKEDSNMVDDDTSLEDFLEKYSDKNLSHLRTQKSFLSNVNFIDFIGRFENFEIDLGKVLKHCSLEHLAIPKLRVTEYDDYTLSPKLVDRINEIYGIDFEFFNYRKVSIDREMKYSEFQLLLESTNR
jgi:hypothetical protein